MEYLVLEQGWSLPRALRLSIPPVWDTEADIWGQEAFDLFTYYRRAFGSLSAWDGPAGIIGTDGRTLVGLVDRMGLRPVRWCSDKRGWLYIGSESGVYGLDPTTIVASGQLQPGQMIALDTATGDRLDSYQIMGRVVAEAKAELGDVAELNRRQIVIPEGFDYTRQIDDAVGAMLAERSWNLDHLLQAAGWDFDRALFVKEMAKLRKEPLSSMGHDRVLTVFSQYHPTLFKYLQLFGTFIRVNGDGLGDIFSSSSDNMVILSGLRLQVLPFLFVNAHYSRSFQIIRSPGQEFHLGNSLVVDDSGRPSPFFTSDRIFENVQTLFIEVEIGLEFKERSPLQPAYMIELAHGYYGYLPPPRQHDLGGYETWIGTNRLERDASVKMLEHLVEMTGELAR